MLPVVVLLAASPSVVVHVAEVSGVERTTAEDLSSLLCEAVESRTGADCRQSEAEWQTCPKPGACLDALRASSPKAEVLLVRFFGGKSSILISAERFIVGTAVNATGGPKNLNVDQRRLNAVRLNRLADKLYPLNLTVSSTVAIPIAGLEPANPTSPLPLVLAGLSAGAGAGALGFGLASRSSQARAESYVLGEADHAAVLKAQRGRATAANVLIGVASASALAAIVWWILDD